MPKEVKTYPIEVLQPGQAFAVPADKGNVAAAKKAVTRFQRQHPRVQFMQAHQRNRFVTWRTKGKPNAKYILVTVAAAPSRPGFLGLSYE